MKKIKIGIIIDSYFPDIDGVVMVVDNYAKRLSTIADVVVIAPASIDKNYVDNFPYRVKRVKSFTIPFAKMPLAAPKFSPGLLKELVSEKFDIIHIHSPFSLGKLGVKLAKEQGIPVIGTMHTQFHLEFLRYTKSKKVTNALVKAAIKVYNECDECWAVNKKVGEVFVSTYNYKGIPKVTSNGTDMYLLPNKKESDDKVNKKYNIKKHDYVFLFVGRITIVKNIVFITEVMKYLKTYKIKFKMLFVGDGPDEKILKDKIRENNIENETLILGKITDREELMSLYSRATLFIFPSLFDASSLVQIEAASQKTPTVFIDGSVTSNTVINDQNGFLAPDDPELFALRIRGILEEKREYNNIAENAYNELYKSWDMLTEETYQKYIEIINEKKSINNKINYL